MSGNPFATIPLNASAELEGQGIPIGKFIKSIENQKSSIRRLSPTSCQKTYELQSDTVNTLNSQALTTSDEELETNYDAGLGNRKLPIN